MTVLQVCAFAAPNAGNFIASLTHLEKKLEQKGIRTVYAFSDGAADKLWCQEIQKRTKVYFLPTAKARILPETYRTFRKIYKENDITVVHSHFELYDIPATLESPKKVKIFWHLHDAIKTHYHCAGIARRLLIRLQYSVMWKNVKLLSVSTEHANFVASLGFRADQIIYFPNGIHTARIQKTSPEEKMPCFLMFGWEVYRKGVDLAIEAARRAKSDFGQILIVGQDECQKYINSQGSVKGIAYRKPVEDVNTLYQTASVFLHISRSEGLSYALLEAIYAGIPVICSDIPENQFARPFRNVWFVESEAVDEISRLICAMARTPVIPTEDDIACNREMIERAYSMDAWAQKLIALYLE